MLSYEYLRLYVNAFAYQATLNRAVARLSKDLAVGERFQGPQGLLFANAAATPDARFIYEALDAAKSLIGTFNSFIDPVQCLRYMPLKYYLYVIYAAVFLFKVRTCSVRSKLFIFIRCRLKLPELSDCRLLQAFVVLSRRR